jgi:hypothetical protein
MCIGCRYDVLGLAPDGVCPECGRSLADSWPQQDRWHEMQMAGECAIAAIVVAVLSILVEGMLLFDGTVRGGRNAGNELVVLASLGPVVNAAAYILAARALRRLVRGQAALLLCGSAIGVVAGVAATVAAFVHWTSDRGHWVWIAAAFTLTCAVLRNQIFLRVAALAREPLDVGSTSVTATGGVNLTMGLLGAVFLGFAAMGQSSPPILLTLLTAVCGVVYTIAAIVIMFGLARKRLR